MTKKASPTLLFFYKIQRFRVRGAGKLTVRVAVNTCRLPLTQEKGHAVQWLPYVSKRVRLPVPEDRNGLS